VDEDRARITRGKLSSLYSEGAEAYEDLWAPELLPLSRELLARLPLQEAGDVLDGGAGVGALLPELRAHARDATITAVDLSFGMIRRAPHEFPRAVMDASNLGFRSESFDVAVFAFVLFHLFDPERGIAEAARVLRSGGAVGTITWGEENDPAAFEVWAEELDRHGAPPRDPDFARFEVLDTAEKVEDSMSKHGLRPVQSWTGEYRAMRTPEEFLAHRTGHGLSRLRLQALSPEVATRCVQAVRKRLDGLNPSDFEERSEVVYAIAEKA
jgi:ubiquinone/menaquinone biosynthesis C-methylase UbiE